ncbi:MAG: P-type conjugative transfer protein TrbL [Rhodospirillaceae bacterium]|nr:P-type conjugative transfer protein TrbL [Rhodospirillaceae bacterium]
MDDLNVIDRFMETFILYIDSGFGLLNSEVAYLTAILIGIDIAIAGLFWTFDTSGNVVPRLIKKVLYVGVFAFIINNFAMLADIIFQSFIGLGLQATNNGLTAADLLRPGKVAGIGFDAAWPLLEHANSMVRFTDFIASVFSALVLLFAWLVVVFAFFILAVQLFITVLEFKLTTLAGFVLVPFALWNKSSFLAERVLGNVISSGIKVMVLAVIVGIGAGFFSDFTSALDNSEPNLGEAMSLVLAAISLFGLGIFGPAIASGLVSGAPQLGAGAAIGTLGGVASATALTGAAAMGGARVAGQALGGAVRAGTSLGAGASTAYQLGRSTSGQSGLAGVGAGIGGVARAGGGMVRSGMGAMKERVMSPLRESAQAGRSAAWRATGGGGTPAAGAPSSATSASGNPAPDWAKSLRTEQRSRGHRHATAQAIKEGDKPSGAANPNLSERDE